MQPELVTEARCAGCGRVFVAVRPNQRHCRPSCGRRGDDQPASLFDEDVDTDQGARSVQDRHGH